MNWLNGVTDITAAKNLADSIQLETNPPEPSFTENLGGAIYDGTKSGLMKLGYEAQKFGATVENLGVGISGQELHLSEAEREKRKQIRDQEAIDRQENLVSKIKPLRVDPTETGFAGQILGPVADIIPRTAAGAWAGGPLVGGVFAGAPEYDASKLLAMDEGIDESTATKKGAIDASVLAIGSTIPAAHFVKSWIADFSLAVGVNAGLGVSARYGTQELLKSNGYDMQAEQYNAFDATALTIDAILGAAFFGIARGPGARGMVDSGLTLNKAHDAQNETGPGIPVDAKSNQIHQDTLSKTIEQLANGEPVNVGQEIQGATFIRGPRGIRNNNPGNIVADGTQWRGMVESTDDRFAAFETPKAGIRALGKNLLTYQDKHGLNTVDQIINRWAPPSENDTGAYAAAVAKALGVSRETPINLHDRDTLKKITTAVIKHENGKQPYSDKVIDDALDSALNGVPIDNAGNTVRHHLMGRDDVSDQFVEDLAQKYEAAATAKEKFDSEINAIMAEAGITQKPIIPDELKGVARAAKKIVSDYNWDISKIKDLNRATIVIDTLDQAQAAISSAQKHFGELQGLRNHLHPESQPITADGYRDIKMNVDLGNGEIAELQINFPQMLKAKDKAHKFYEKSRELIAKTMLEDRKLTAAEIKQLDDWDQEQRNIYDAAWAEVTKSLKARSDKSVPLWAADAPLNGRGSGPSQAKQVQSLANETGTPSTSKNLVPGGKSGSFMVDTPFTDIIHKNLMGHKSIAYSERGDAVETQFAVVEDSTLTTSHDNSLAVNDSYPAELQPRDRTRDASEAQISRIANKINPELLAESPKISDGAPIVGRDGIVESGNARTIALRRAYESGKGEGYREWLITNAKRFGLNETELSSMKNPVLVRLRNTDIDRAEFARMANEAGVATMSVVEQAKADAARIRSLDGMVAADDGTINFKASNVFTRNFINDAVAPTEQGSMIGPDGKLSQQGETRIKNAVFAKAYGDSEVVGMMAESTDTNIKNIMNGMLRAAPAVARLREMISEGGRYPLDIAPDLVKAVREFSDMRAKGYSVEQFLAQQDMFDFEITPELNNLLIGLQENSRAPKRIADMINQYVAAVDDLGDPRQGSLIDDTPPLAQDLIADSIETQRVKNEAPSNTDLFGTPEMQAADAVAELNPSMKYTLDDGREVTVAEAIAIADDAVAEAEIEAQAFNAAVVCFNRTG